ncbi:hypothetical protein F5Y16DRAFT_396251 [Xylariaceae sp. FL0255]|nr:hypothetical protein F5Y16DRAFT_396251 [Xylariaceae sp. FL0255]
MRSHPNIDNSNLIQQQQTHGEHSTTRKARGHSNEFDRWNAFACVVTCFDQFIGGSDVVEVCESLERSPENQQQELWDLYCCDSIQCGVYIDKTGDSPNVDNIINQCQNHGIFSINDPGPPSSSYCTSTRPPLSWATGVSSTRRPVGGPAIETFSSVAFVSTPSSTSALLTDLITSTTPATTASASSSTRQPDIAAAPSKQLKGGPKAAIVVFSLLGAASIAVILLYLLHRRRHRPNSRPRPPGSLSVVTRHNNGYPEPPSGSQTPLITPPPTATSSRNPPLTPPARLSDRKYIQTMLKQGTFRPSGVSSTGDLAFPASTICAPTHSRHLPQYERRATTSHIGVPLTTSTPVFTHYAQSSVYSLSSGPEASSLTVQSIKASSVHSGSATITGTSTPPLSPTRLPRSRDGPQPPSENADLVTPAGPPPNRALPAPPLNHPNLPTFSISPVTPRSPTFSARSMVLGAASNAGSGKQQQQCINNKNSTSPPLSTSTKELCELTESYARESWGSWSGVGGGGPGVNPTGRKRGSGGSAEKKPEVGSAVGQQQLDLEKLSGRY